MYASVVVPPPGLTGPPLLLQSTSTRHLIFGPQSSGPPGDNLHLPPPAATPASRSSPAKPVARECSSNTPLIFSTTHLINGSSSSGTSLIPHQFFLTFVLNFLQVTACSHHPHINIMPRDPHSSAASLHYVYRFI